MESKISQCEIGGQTLTIESGKLAGLANGSVTVHYGETVLLVAVCASREPREGVDFMPLTVDFEERLYAAGKIPGSFFRREGRPGTDAILAGRLTDRPLRPLFPKNYHNDVQITITVLSVDKVNDPDILGIIGSSAALTISDIPWLGPVGAVRVGYIDKKLVINPAMADLEKSELELVVAGTKDAVMMIEAGAKEVSEALLVQALKFGHEEVKKIVDIQTQLATQVGKPKLKVADESPEEKALHAAVQAEITSEKLAQVLETATKEEREDRVAAILSDLNAKLGAIYKKDKIAAAFDEIHGNAVRRLIMEGKRPDGRGWKEIRPISCEVGILPRTHGSALFNRGVTQVLNVTTLGSMSMKQTIDSIGLEESKRYMHHYNFPSYSTGEVKRSGSPGRREIGHGALAERALVPVIPSEVDFPYTIRLVSEVLSSNGSTSMASVCSSSMSLMDAGVPIKAPVAGIAMGLILSEDGQRHAILTDIQGIEDHMGDMDFKVAGTKDGVTALQLDIKTTGININVMDDALAQAKEARMFILGKMAAAIPAVRPVMSPYAPRITKLMVNPEKIGTIIGPGGKTIRSIIEATGATIDVQNDGTVLIGATSGEAAQKAVAIIEGLTREAKIGEVYTGRVTRIMNFGAFVEILPGKEGMVHISELADHRIDTVEDAVHIGDELKVKVIEIDRMGRVNLSHRATLEGGNGGGAAPAGGDRERGGDRGDRGGDRGGRGGERREYQPREPRESREPVAQAPDEAPEGGERRPSGKGIIGPGTGGRPPFRDRRR